MKKLLCLAICTFILGCGGSGEVVKNDVPTERPPRPQTDGGSGGGQGGGGSQQSAESI
ncbi:MAG: hypothetical protein KDB03_09675 [Planctomycetales bacterium]|nr:hypothetical protein [Planctomycetales bacterium]